MENAKADRANSLDNQSRKPLKLKDLMPPFRMGEDIGNYLVNFERTCENNSIHCSTWSQNLLEILPCEAAEVLALLPNAEVDDYETVKAALLRKYRLWADEFFQRFRKMEKRGDESFQDFAYNLKANLTAWLKGAEAYDDRDKVIEEICLEQFYNRLNEETRLWVSDRPEKKNVERAAELAEEFQIRRGACKESLREILKPYRDFVKRSLRSEYQAHPTRFESGLRKGDREEDTAPRNGDE